MTIEKAQRDKVEIAYATFGGAPGDPLLLVRSVGAQMIYWHDEFCGAVRKPGEDFLGVAQVHWPDGSGRWTTAYPLPELAISLGSRRRQTTGGCSIRIGPRLIV